MIHLAVLIQYRSVTDTDRQTHDDDIYCTSIASCGKNEVNVVFSEYYIVELCQKLCKLVQEF